MILEQAGVLQRDYDRPGRDPRLGFLANDRDPLADREGSKRTIGKFLNDRIAGQVDWDGAVQCFDKNAAVFDAFAAADADHRVAVRRSRRRRGHWR